jgi:hypothetical protein
MVHVNYTHILIRNKDNKLWNIHELNFQLRSTMYYSIRHTNIIEEYQFEQYIALELNSNNFGYYFNTRTIETWNQEHDVEMDTYSVKNYIKQKVDTSYKIWDDIEIYDEHLLIHATNIVIACDGGSKDDKIGTIGIVMSADETIVLKLKAKIPDIFGKMTSYRSECYGIMGSLHLLSILQDYKLMRNMDTRYNIKIHCDNKAAVDNINYLSKQKITLKQHYSSDMDVIMECINNIKNYQAVTGLSRSFI